MLTSSYSLCKALTNPCKSISNLQRHVQLFCELGQISNWAQLQHMKLEVFKTLPPRCQTCAGSAPQRHKLPLNSLLLFWRAPLVKLVSLIKYLVMYPNHLGVSLDGTTQWNISTTLNIHCLQRINHHNSVIIKLCNLDWHFVQTFMFPRGCIETFFHGSPGTKNKSIQSSCQLWSHFTVLLSIYANTWTWLDL